MNECPLRPARLPKANERITINVGRSRKAVKVAPLGVSVAGKSSVALISRFSSVRDQSAEMSRRQQFTRNCYKSGPRRRKKREELSVLHILIMAAMFGLFVYAAVPRVQSGWSRVTMSNEERQRIERSAFYRNCDAARAAGAAPIFSGSPGYRDEMDGDGDGIACEPYPR